MSLKLPDVVQVGGKKYPVLFPYHFKETNEYQGQCDYSVGEIRINDLAPGGVTKPVEGIVSTYFHEILHFIDHIYLQGWIGEQDECERIISGLSEGLTQVYMAKQLPAIEE
jgi:hypothetical protein